MISEDTSISQIETFDGCPSKWAYGHVHGIWPARDKHKDDGVDVHQHIENYSLLGQKFDNSPLGKIAALAKPWLPTAADEPLIEHKSVLMYDGHNIKMAVDAVWLAPMGDSGVMNDYKSVKHFGFILTPPKLRANLQAAAYSLKYMQHFGVTTMDLRWIYLQRPPDDADETYTPDPLKDIRVVQATVDEDDVRAVLRSKQRTMDSMARIKKARLPMAEITRNETHCTAYAGCGYRGKCFPGKFNAETGKPL